MKKVDINLKNIYLKYPVFSDTSKSLKKSIVDTLTGGKISTNEGIVCIEALSNINLSLKKGDRLGLIGANGSGKTSLLRVIAGLIYPTKGEISINGSINSFIDMNFGLNMEATGLENIKIRLILLGISLGKIDYYLSEISDFCELGKFLYMPIKTYSSGMVMRLGFSILAAVYSDIIIMDEWLSVGDEDFKSKAELKIERIISNSPILILASHDMNIINKWCNKVIKLDRGEISK